MARPESVAVAGYFPLPQHLVPVVASMLEARTVEDDARQPRPTVLDPVAGDGYAVFELAKHLDHATQIIAFELEEHRAKTLGERLGYSAEVFHADAFSMTWERKHGLSLLYLNPPYDLDKVHGRLEQRFLERFAPTLTVGGVLVFVVPHVALEASAELLARDFTDLACFRFPEPDYAVFKQVVLFARYLGPDEHAGGPLERQPCAATVQQIKAWARGEHHELLGRSSTKFVVPSLDRWASTISYIRKQEFDAKRAIDHFELWHERSPRGERLRPLQNTLLELPQRSGRPTEFPMAMPPRPAHIAAALASGVFDGAEVTSKTEGAPRLLVKGVFDREFVETSQKVNKDGEAVASVQEQRPKLVVTVLDMSSWEYHELRSSPDVTGSKDPATMTVSDLLEHYGPSLIERMRQQCPVLFDPQNKAHVEAIPLRPMPCRSLWEAQAYAAQATVMLLGGSSCTLKQRARRAAFVLGEVGCGKTSIALQVAHTIQARRTLVVCPPHLTTTWVEEVKACHGDTVATITIDDLDAVDAFASHPGPVVGVMSREAAKLGHALESVTKECPSCGCLLEATDFAKTRAKCQGRELVAKNDLAMATMAASTAVVALASSRLDEMLPRVARRRKAPRAFTREAHEKAYRILEAAVVRKFESSELGCGDPIWRLIEHVMAASPEPKRTAEAWFARFEERNKQRLNGAWGDEMDAISVALAIINPNKTHKRVSHGIDGDMRYDDVPMGSLKALVNAIVAAVAQARWGRGKVCGQPLYYSVPRPRRTQLAKALVRRHGSNAFDLLIGDESHEYNGDGSAQSIALQRLAALGRPVLLLTGSLMNGYAESLFSNQWLVDESFRQEFDRDGRAEFVRRYGYLKRIVDLKDDDKRKDAARERGAVTDREERARITGTAPGVLDLFLLKYLLKMAVPIQKKDLALGLPKCHEERVMIDPSPMQGEQYKKLEQTLRKTIREDRNDEELSGKLFGQLAELVSYMDRASADQGNGVRPGEYVIRYPESVGGAEVASAPGLDAEELLPKESWMLDTIERELEQGRNVIVLAWHPSLFERYRRLVARAHGKTAVEVLYSDKVPTKKRKDWIAKIVARNVRVLIVNPVAVQTGLNNLVHFQTQLWMENPSCDPTVYRQTVGRIDRPLQRKETLIYFPVYRGIQELAHTLLMQKAAVALAVDGLDAEGALRASGVGDMQFSAMSVGKQLFAMLESA